MHLQRTLVQLPNPFGVRLLAQEFEALHEISHIIEAIDGSHNLILISIIGGES